VRELHKAQRTAAINLARGLLREFGVVIPPARPRWGSPQGRTHDCNRTVCL